MTPELQAKLAGRRVVASVSGGKDSAAMSLHLRELGIEHDRVFMDTGWEHHRTYDYLRGELTRVLGPITEIRGDLLMPDLIRKKGMFPSRTRRYCTEELKVLPMKRYLAALDYDVVNTIGIRKAESKSRSRMVEWEWSSAFDCETWRPILDWTEGDVIAIHGRHGLPPNPLYLEGAERVGCWPCIFSRKAEVRRVADTDPERIALIRQLEAEAATVNAARAAGRGEAIRKLGSGVGIFVGGTTAWKLATMGAWGQLARERGGYYHVGRVNTARRIQMCALSGAHSFDGTSASKFAVTLRPLDNARRQTAWVL